eukprot:s2604_g8.t1
MSFMIVASEIKSVAANSRRVHQKLCFCVAFELPVRARHLRAWLKDNLPLFSLQLLRDIQRALRLSDPSVAHAVPGGTCAEALP